MLLKTVHPRLAKNYPPIAPVKDVSDMRSLFAAPDIEEARFVEPEPEDEDVTGDMYAQLGRLTKWDVAADRVRQGTSVLEMSLASARCSADVGNTITSRYCE